MTVCDCAHSYMTFVTPGRGNNARLQVEGRCVITDGELNTSHEYALVASCKGEDTFGIGPLVLVPSYDFCGVFSREEFVILRAFASAADNRPEWGPVSPRFEKVRIDLHEVEAEELTTPAAVVQASLANRPLVAHTEITDPSQRFRVLLEYPIKTMNANDIRHCWQVDTGPVPFVDWTIEAERLAQRFRLAFVVYSTFDKAEFVVQVPTPLQEGGRTIATVNHYSEIHALPARNRLFAFT
jgi:hypothetical protein